MYTKIAKAEPFSGAPKINIASLFGASPNKDVILRIPATGERPMTFDAKGLPEGLSLNGNIITGKAAKEGSYDVTLIAKNALGTCEKKVTFEIYAGKVLLTPLLGFTTWSAFKDRVTEKMYSDTAKALVRHGISEYGYSYVNLDSGWQYKYGGKLDAIQPNPKFPDMKAMVDGVHALGLKCGIYSTPMLTAWGCPAEYESIPGCTQGEPDERFAEMNGGIGIIHKEKNNVLQWAEWGFDYLKYDWDPTDPVNAEIMRQELLAADRDFGFCVTVNALPCYNSYWSTHCNSYRRNVDAQGFWENLLEIYETYIGNENNVNKGHFFDLDMLDIGNSAYSKRPNFMNDDEAVVAYSMRAFLNSPIQISEDLTEEISETYLSIYCNEEIIAINQDTKFAPSVFVYRRDIGSSRLHAFEKELEDGSFAYALFNLGECEEQIKTELSEISNIRDVWAKENLAFDKELDVTMPAHTVRIFKCDKKAKDFWTK